MSNAYRVTFAISDYGSPLGVLSAQIARAVNAARAAIGSTARMKCYAHTTGILGHIYDLEFVQGEHAYHPLQVEQAIYEQLRGYHVIAITQAMIDDDVCGDVMRAHILREVSTPATVYLCPTCFCPSTEMGAVKQPDTPGDTRTRAELLRCPCGRESAYAELVRERRSMG